MCTGLGLGSQSPAGPTWLPVLLQPRGQPARPPHQESQEPAGHLGAEFPSARGREACPDGFRVPEEEENAGTEAGGPPHTQQGTLKRCRRLGTTLTGALTAALASKVDARHRQLCRRQPSERPAGDCKPSLTCGAATVSYTHLTLPTIHVLCRSRWSPYH